MQTDTTPEPPPDLDPDLCHERGLELQRLGHTREAAAFYRAALARDPTRPDTWANLGLTILAQGLAAEAMYCQREALRLDPARVEAHNNLGIAAHALNALAEAENHFRGALRLCPDHANATLNLGVTRHSLGYTEEAETLYRRARELGADPARAANNLALCLVERDRLDEAEAACRAALAAAPGYPEAAVNLAMILLMHGRFREAWPHYEARWSVPPLANTARLPAATRWTGAQDLNGKTILLQAEQGFGDTLHFCRYAPMLAARGARVAISAPGALVRLMKSVPGVAVVADSGEPLPDHDFHCPMMSLPMAFDTVLETIPGSVAYLSPPADEAAAWRDRLAEAEIDGKLKIGLVWAGGQRPDQPQAAAIDRRRSMHLSTLLPLAGVKGCVFVSLQVGLPAKQAEMVPFPLIHAADGFVDFADTAALISALDLVIAVDTAVAHLAGALGQPVWLLSRFDACWRWLRGRDDTPWYPTMRLFRQTAPGDWDGVVRRATAALAQFQIRD